MKEANLKPYSPSSIILSESPLPSILFNKFHPNLCVLASVRVILSAHVTGLVVPSVQQKSSGLKFSKSRTGSHMTYSRHHNSSRFTFPIFVHLWRFSVFHSLQLITPRIY